ncbi:rhamnosyltransferase [Microbacterium sp. AG1240]|uniref:glycosyltransferase n=1 Tax=Microbacterium sp. AG1240 TaxID=2183992 RepID=UPI000EB2C936|nr:glycosyltransferase [Microbacterium sp. AG1240]RKT36339.1 rhamnosyltransferase [Microbacterium sp. AG1240]
MTGPRTRPSAVIATFRPPEALADLVAVLARDCDVVVVDDGSGSGSDAVYEAAEYAGAQVVRHEENRGIAHALNIGVQRALSSGADAVFTFDQDSSPADDFIEQMSDALSRARESISSSVAAIVPEFFADTAQSRGADLAPGLCRARKVIQSGMLVPREAWNALGALRDDYFIDLVDTEFEMRALTHGWEVLAARGVSMPHSLGRMIRLRLAPGLQVTTSVSTPFRYFYRARNRVVLSRSYARRAPVRVLSDAGVDLAYFVVAVLGARPRRSLAHIIVRGLGAGFRGTMGRLPARLSNVADGVRWSGVEVSRDGVAH